MAPNCKQSGSRMDRFELGGNFISIPIQRGNIPLRAKIVLAANAHGRSPRLCALNPWVISRRLHTR